MVLLDTIASEELAGHDGLALVVKKWMKHILLEQYVVSSLVLVN